LLLPMGRLRCQTNAKEKPRRKETGGAWTVLLWMLSDVCYTDLTIASDPSARRAGHPPPTGRRRRLSWRV